MKSWRNTHYPRWVARVYAFFGAYFWSDCPICGRMFGGHETGRGLMTSWSEGQCTCWRCDEEAERRNAAFIKKNPPPPIYIDDVVEPK